MAVRDCKARIEVGDVAHPSFGARAREVIDARTIPEFRQEDYAAGILATSSARHNIFPHMRRGRWSST